MPVENKTTSKYSVPGFDIVNWYEEFWQDESDSIMNHITHDDFIALCCLDIQLLEQHTSNGTNYLEISKTCQDLGGMMLLVRKRTLWLDFPCTEGVCAFIQQISKTPGRAVMLCTALALAWEQRNQDMIVSIHGDERFADIPSMDWIANMFNSGFVVGQKSKEGPQWIDCDMWGFPDAAHMKLMWDRQKRTTREAFESDNFLDLVTHTPGAEKV